MPYDNMTQAALAQRSQERRDRYQAKQEAKLGNDVGALNALRAEMIRSSTQAIGNPWDAYTEAVAEAQDNAEANGMKFQMRAGPSAPGSNQLRGISAQPRPSNFGLRASLAPVTSNWQSLEGPAQAVTSLKRLR